MPSETPIQDKKGSPRVDIPDPKTLGPEIRTTLENIGKAFGQIPELAKSMALCPEVVKPMFETHHAIESYPTIEPRMREIARIRASVKNGSDYCLHTHMDLGLRAGLSHKQIDALRTNPGGGEFTEKEQIVIEYSDLLTRDPSGLPDELFDRLHAHFSDSEIVHLTLVIAMINAFNRYSEALKLHPGH